MVKSVRLATLAVLFVGACVAPAAPPPTAPNASAGPTQQGSAAPASVRWIVYYARDLADPLPVTVDGPAPATTVGARVRQRIQLVCTAPRSGDGGVFNVLPTIAARLAAVTVEGDLATLDYTVPDDDWGLNGSVMLRAFVQQVVYTATEEPGVVRVLLTQNGGREAVIGGEGLVIASPQTRAGISRHTDLTPLQAARLVRMTTTGAQPLLMLNGIASDWTADVRADVNTFTVTYRDPSGMKTVTLAIAIADLPLPRVESPRSAPHFRGDAASLYEVASASDPRTERRLIWTEPGSWSVPGPAGVPYILSASGLTDLEFWRFADSLRPVQI